MKRIHRYLFVFWLLLLPFAAFAQQKSAEVRRLEQKRKAMQDEIARVDKALKQTATSAKQQLQQLTLLEGQIAARQEVIVSLEQEIQATDNQLYALEQEIVKLQEQFEKRQEAYVKSLRALQRGNNMQDQLLFILSADDFAQALRRARYLREYASWQKEEGEKLKALREELDKKKSELELQRQEKALLLQGREQEQNKLQENRQQLSAKVKELKGKEKQLRDELARHKKQARALNRQIEAQIAKEIKEAEEARKRALAKNKTPDRKATSKGGYAMTKEEVKLSKNFVDNRGRLPMPISGSARIVSRFGVQQHAGLRHVQVQNNGIDIQGSAGAEARAVFDGEVTTIFSVEGYNANVIVRHGNYLTVYSNLSSVYVTKGTKVKTGQALGKIYQDPDLGGATLLHFQLWKERAKLNPEDWLR